MRILNESGNQHTLQNQNHDWLEAVILKAAFAVIGACGIGYAGYTYKTINEYQDFKLQAEKSFVEIQTKLDFVIKDIEYHHRDGDVKVQH